jgi:hypothetical protein
VVSNHQKGLMIMLVFFSTLHDVFSLFFPRFFAFRINSVCVYSEEYFSSLANPTFLVIVLRNTHGTKFVVGAF